MAAITQILDHATIVQKTRRMAHEIVEQNYGTKELVIIGIAPGGYDFAALLQIEIAAVMNISTHLLWLQINKKNPLDDSISLSDESFSLDNKIVLIVDDVANTGKTLYYALKPIMNFAPAKVQLAVLVDRQHKLFPISCDFVGLSLSTTLQEHISVVKTKGEWQAFLQ